MKKTNLMLNAAVVLVVVSSALAFKPATFHDPNLFYKTTASGNPCTASTNATNAAGAIGTPTQEANFSSGYFTDGGVNGCTITEPSPKAVDAD